MSVTLELVLSLACFSLFMFRGNFGLQHIDGVASAYRKSDYDWVLVVSSVDWVLVVSSVDWVLVVSSVDWVLVVSSVDWVLVVSSGYW